MTARADVTVDYDLSPRLAEIALPSEQINVQDSHDTLTNAQGTPEGMQHSDLVSTAGGEALGGGTTVGLTTTLLDIQYAFEATSPRSSGTNDTLDSLGKTLEDTTATFISDGVVRGDWVINFTDQSVTEIITVTSETILVTRGLRNGTANTFAVSDVYKVWEVSEAQLEGGNFVAIDSVQADLNPVFPSFGRFVSKASASSATTANQEQLEYSTYGGGVTVNVSAGIAGTAFPIGTPSTPVSNLADAKLIATERGFNTLFFRTDTTIATENFDNFKFIGVSEATTLLTFDTSSSVINCEINSAKVTGILDGGSTLRRCEVLTLDMVNGIVEDCVILGPITLGGVVEAIFKDCASGVAGQATPTIDCGGDGPDLIIRGWSGGITLANKTGATGSTSIDMDSGQVIFASTVSDGTITVRGICKVTDNSTGSATIIDETLDATKLNEVWALLGLDINNPMTVTTTARVAGLIAQTISGDGTTTSTVTRDP